MINFEPNVPWNPKILLNISNVKLDSKIAKPRINNFETKGKDYQNPAIFHDFHEA